MVASLDLRGATPHDVEAAFDRGRGALLACNASHPDWVRVFGSATHPTHWCATTDEEGAYSPGQNLPYRAAETRALTGALQFDLLLLPRQRHNLRLITAFSPQGRAAALDAYDAVRGHDHALRGHDHALRDIVAHYASVRGTATVAACGRGRPGGTPWARRRPTRA